MQESSWLLIIIASLRTLKKRGVSLQKTLCQIGIDVLPQYRGKGIGTNLVTLLKQELLNRGKIPYYGTAVSHINSKNVAINAGFFPAWAEVYSRKIYEK